MYIMNAFLFPGQGSQIVGMGSEFYNNFNSVKKIFQEADAKLNLPLSKIILNGPEDQLKLTKITQPAILVVSYSIFKILKEEFNFNFDSTKYFAGHSLGEYSALVCSGSLNFQDALYLLHERGKSMQDAVPIGKGSMIAILGANLSQINDIIQSEKKDNKGICEVANDNSDGQVILSGDKETVKKFQLLLKDQKIKSIPLKVSAPFHCSLMRPAADAMIGKIESINFETPSFSVVSNVTAKTVKDPVEIKKLLIDQIFSTVRWRESILNIFDQGVTNFIEIGPGKVLTGMVKRTLTKANCFSINSIADIKNTINELKK